MATSDRLILRPGDHLLLRSLAASAVLADVHFSIEDLGDLLNLRYDALQLQKYSSSVTGISVDS